MNIFLFRKKLVKGLPYILFLSTNSHIKLHFTNIPQHILDTEKFLFWF